MTFQIIDGKETAARLREQIKETVSQLDPKPGLAVIIVGDHPASKTYVTGKENAAKDIGMHFEKIELPDTIQETELLKKIDELNSNEAIHGFIVQLPLPKHIDEKLVIESILPMKDADGFSPINLGNLMLNNNSIVSATPKGIIKLLEEYNIELEGRHAVIVGRSNIVGKPIALLLQQKHCTVTMCHSKTKDLKNITKDADILVAAVGKPNLITKDMVKKGAVVIDVGTSRLEDGTLTGDVDFENVKKVASHITPVPGGVGPMTITMLLENCLECYNLQR
ncbi:bifunctional methylenetetrahydrofolate dehydrogenase/methenyltetrahydrofolate cyclohydrolase FolD [Candidatus Woesearchaeota archaeon]|nr:bifunctional methylenetetrahydrofolate dehydrogenase/methenyltetrahydrofolate cyclohydrolase FolD [Candidatus Woesearchaeota archaeon]